MLTITGSRIFETKTENAQKARDRCGKFIEGAQKIGPVVLAIHTAEDKADLLGFCKTNYPDVDAFAVTPWQKFVAPLNAIVYRSALMGGDRLLLASAEFPPTAEQVQALSVHVHNGTLVAGARFSEHIWKGGQVEGTGSTVPWNTFALWNLKHLAKLGFPLAGDASFDQKQAGVEEVTAIAVYQKMFALSAKLISVRGFYEEWNMAGWDAERIAKHEAKIASKSSRPAAQLAWAGLTAPMIDQVG